MKNLGKIFGLSLLFSSVCMAAVNVVVKGVPVTLLPYKQIYQLPPNYPIPTQGYLYVTVDGNNSVCYTQVNPKLQALQMSIITINMNGQNMDWNCYLTSSTSSTNQ